MISKVAHEAALEPIRLPSSTSTVLRAIHRACDYATGVGQYALCAARLAWRTEMPRRTVEWALCWLRTQGWIYVVGRGEHRGNIYGLKLPSQAPSSAEAPRAPEAPTAPSWAGRFAGWVRGVVGAPPVGVRDGPAPVAGLLGAALLPAIVPFLGGRAPDPSYVPRPNFEAPAEDNGPLFCTACHGLGREGGDLRAELCSHCGGNGREPESDRAATPMLAREPAELDVVHPRPDRARDPDDPPPPDIWHVGPLLSPEEHARHRLDRPPTFTDGPGDRAPYRRLLQTYRREAWRARGVQPPIVPHDHLAITWLIRNFGIDAAERLVVATFRGKMGRWASIQTIAARARAAGR